MHRRRAEDFIHRCRFTNTDFNQLAFAPLVQHVYTYAETVWITPNHGDFVDHGIDHSYEVLHKALKLLETILRAMPPEKQLSDMEKLVLALAALIHDTGMQADKYLPPTKRLSLDGARQEHVQRGQALLQAALGGDSEFKGLPTLRDLRHSSEVLWKAGIVGFAHSGQHVWSEVERNSEYDDAGWDEMPLRVRMLAAALRLADELDNGYSRVPELSRVTSVALDAETAAHWCACYYIDEVRIHSPATGVAIEIVMRAPKGAPEEDKTLILELIRDLRLRRMEEERQRVGKWLCPPGDRPAVIEIKLGGVMREQMIDGLPQSVADYLETKAMRTAANREALSIVPLIAKQTTELARAAEILRFSCDTMRASQIGHFALRTGWHTNRYFDLSAVLADAKFQEYVTVGLVSLYKGQGLQQIISVGTAGLQIGNPLALALGCHHDFTFAQNELALSPSRMSREYSIQERTLTLREGARTLVVDDIIGVGSAAVEVCGRLAVDKREPKVTSVFTLLSLGRDKNSLGVLDDVKVTSLLEMPDVDYWRENAAGECAFCKGVGVEVRREVPVSGVAVVPGERTK